MDLIFVSRHKWNWPCGQENHNASTDYPEILQLSIIYKVGKSHNPPPFTTYLGESDWNIFEKIPLPLEASKNVLNGWYFFYWWVGYIFGNLSWIVSDDSTQNLTLPSAFEM